MSLCKCHGGNKEKKESIHIITGLFFFINYSIGTGYLSFPYAFTYSGYLAATLTVVVISSASWIGSNYILEVSSRAQALQKYKEEEAAESDSSDSGESDSSNCSDCECCTDDEKERKLIPCHGIEHPLTFEVLTKKFEVPELCQIFFHRYVKYTYLAIQTVLFLLMNWTYATVSASSWATNIPYHYLSSYLTCSDQAFLHNALPSPGCLYAYYVSLTAFGLIVVTISLLELKQQAYIQLLFGLMKMITILAAVVYSIFHLIQGGDACSAYESTSNQTLSNIELSSVVAKFDARGWLQSISVFIFGYIFQTGIPSLIHPVKQKKYLHWLILSNIVVLFLSYTGLGVALSLWFRAAIQETCTLNWAPFIQPGYSIPLRIFSYYIILFPSVDIISVYPLSVHVATNNIYPLITKHDTSDDHNFKHKCLLLIVLRFAGAVLPIAMALGMSNLVYIITASGFLLLASYVPPFLLQVQSIRVCKKIFADINGKGKELLNFPQKVGSPEKKCCFLQNDNFVETSCYTTPYSYPVISHQITAFILSFYGVGLVALLVAAFFVRPANLNCVIMDDLL